MATANFQIDQPSANAIMQNMLDGAVDTQEKNLNSIDAGVKMDQLNTINNYRTLPQLQSTAGANGQVYSTAYQKDLAENKQDMAWQKWDITSGLLRQNDELDRQRMYAATGLIL